MKEVFSNPEMDIKKFKSENIVTASGLNGNKVAGKPDEQEYRIGSMSIDDFTDVISDNFVW